MLTFMWKDKLNQDFKKKGRTRMKQQDSFMFLLYRFFKILMQALTNIQYELSMVLSIVGFF